MVCSGHQGPTVPAVLQSDILLGWDDQYGGEGGVGVMQLFRRYISAFITCMATQAWPYFVTAAALSAACFSVLLR